MKTIKKKILPKYFGDVVTGAKQFELRKDDDDIQVGDELELIEWDGEPTGKVVRCDVTYVLRNCVEYGLMDGYCIVGISTPTVDAVPVVRCKDCRYCRTWYFDKDGDCPSAICTFWDEDNRVNGIDVYKNGFCSNGERREDGKI